MSDTHMTPNFAALRAKINALPGTEAERVDALRVLGEVEDAHAALVAAIERYAKRCRTSLERVLPGGVS